MKLLTTVIFLIFAFGIIFVFYRRDRINRYASLMSFVITVIAVFIGVFFTDYIDEQRIVKIEKEQITLLVQQTVEDVKAHLEERPIFLNLVNKQGWDINYLLDNNPTFEPMMLDSLLLNHLLPKYCLPASQPLFKNQYNVRRLLDIVNDHGKPSAQRLAALNNYFLVVELTKQQLEATRRCIEGEIDYKEFNELKRALLLKDVPDV